MAFSKSTFSYLNRIFNDAGITDWQESAARNNISNIALYNRIRGGMNPYYACTSPVKQRRKKVIHKIFRKWVVSKHNIIVTDEPVTFIWEEPLFEI